jgi:hypothetical protein
MSSKKKELKRIQKYCAEASKNLFRASKSKDPDLIWAILANVQHTINGYESAAEALYIGDIK